MHYNKNYIDVFNLFKKIYENLHIENYLKNSNSNIDKSLNRWKLLPFSNPIFHLKNIQKIYRQFTSCLIWVNRFQIYTYSLGRGILHTDGSFFQPLLAHGISIHIFIFEHTYMQAYKS